MQPKSHLYLMYIQVLWTSWAKEMCCNGLPILSFKICSLLLLYEIDFL